MKALPKNIFPVAPRTGEEAAGRLQRASFSRQAGFANLAERVIDRALDTRVRAPRSHNEIVLDESLRDCRFRFLMT